MEPKVSQKEFDQDHEIQQWWDPEELVWKGLNDLRVEHEDCVWRDPSGRYRWRNCHRLDAEFSHWGESGKFKLKQVKIKRMIGNSVPTAVLQQISDKKTGSEMWNGLCNLFEAKQTEATKDYIIRRLLNDLWQIRLRPEEDKHLHLCKMFSIGT